MPTINVFPIRVPKYPDKKTNQRDNSKKEKHFLQKRSINIKSLS